MHVSGLRDDRADSVVNYCVRPGSCEPSAATPETFSRHMCQTLSCLAPLERKAYVRKSSHRWRVVDVRVNPTVNSGCVFVNSGVIN